MWAGGDGVIHYRFGSFLVDPATAPAYSIGTAPGYVCPSSLNLAEKVGDVVNVYDWTTQDRDAPLAGDGARRRERAAVRPAL